MYIGELSMKDIDRSSRMKCRNGKIQTTSLLDVTSHSIFQHSQHLLLSSGVVWQLKLACGNLVKVRKVSSRHDWHPRSSVLLLLELQPFLELLREIFGNDICALYNF